MPVCSICKAPRRAKFQTPDLTICHHCVTVLNRASITAQQATSTLRDQYKEATRRGIINDLASAHDEEFAYLQKRLDQIEEITDRNFDSWLKRRINAPTMPSKEIRYLRAHRKGLISFEAAFFPRPSSWDEKASAIRIRDKLSCAVCGARNIELHVHHIIHLSRNGTNRRVNLVTLCFSCHQEQHDQPIGRSGDTFGQSQAQATDRAQTPPSAGNAVVQGKSTESPPSPSEMSAKDLRVREVSTHQHAAQKPIPPRVRTPETNSRSPTPSTPATSTWRWPAAYIAGLTVVILLLSQCLGHRS